MMTFRKTEIILAVLLFLSFCSVKANAENIDLTNLQNKNTSIVKTAKITKDINTNASDDLKNQLNCAQEEIVKLQESNYYLKSAFVNNKNEFDSLKQTNQTLNTLVQLKDKQINELKQLNEDKLSEVINAKSNEINKLKSSISVYREKIDDLSEKLIKVSNEFNPERYQKLVNDNLELQKKSENLQNQMQNNKNTEIYKKAYDFLQEDKNLNHVYYYNLARAYQAEGNTPKTIENYKLALESSSKMIQALRQLGIVYAEAGDYGNSIKSFNEYLSYINNQDEKEIIKQFIDKMEK